MMVHPTRRKRTYEQYCALPGYNASLLKVVDSRSLLHARAYMDGQMERQSDALDFGTSFHELLLRDREDFVVHPETYPATKTSTAVKEGKCQPGDPIPWNMAATYCKEWVREHSSGSTVYEAAEATKLRFMVDAVKAHPELAPLLHGQSELAVTHEKDGVKYKALVDLLPVDKTSPVIDFKTCRSAKPSAFVRDAINFGYPIQAALNLDLLRWNGDSRSEFWFVAIEDAPPFAIWIMKLRDVELSLLRMGRRRYRAAVKKLQEAEYTGIWPAYEDGEPENFIPSYLKPELEHA